MKFFKPTFILFFSFILTLFSSCKSENVEVSSIPDSSFNKDWLFQKDSIAGAETVNFNDSHWQEVTLPHDWSIYGPFDNKYNARTGGLPVHGIGWYRKHFTIEKGLEGKQIAVEFDGAMSNSKVYLNGKYIGERPYGYIGFEFDLTEHINFGGGKCYSCKISTRRLIYALVCWCWYL